MISRLKLFTGLGTREHFSLKSVSPPGYNQVTNERVAGALFSLWQRQLTESVAIELTKC